MNGPNNPIGWCGFTWNPIKGKCPLACPYCYARRIYDRFHYDPTIRFDAKEFISVEKLKKPARIFVGSTIELFGDWIPDDWILAILEQARKHPQHIFQFLTKCPVRMAQFEFPGNCWCGLTTTSQEDYQVEYLRFVAGIKNNPLPVRFLSCEPLHSNIQFHRYHFIHHVFNWIIIGAETGNRRGKIIPKEEWVKNIVEQADEYEISIFMKDNLKPYWHGELRQEFPK